MPKQYKQYGYKTHPYYGQRAYQYWRDVPTQKGTKVVPWEVWKYRNEIDTNRRIKDLDRYNNIGNFSHASRVAVGEHYNWLHKRRSAGDWIGAKTPPKQRANANRQKALAQRKPYIDLTSNPKKSLMVSGAKNRFLKRLRNY